MSKAKAVITYNGEKTEVQCLSNEKLRNIFERYGTKAVIDINNISFLYNGRQINEDLNFEEILNKEDKLSNEINIIGIEKNIKKKEIKEIHSNLKKSKDIICQECQENILIKIEDYKINEYNCKNGHEINNILIKEFYNNQMIDISKIICGNCKEKNKANTFQNVFYRCLTCNINICPLCKSIHDEEHVIINYENINYICIKHNEAYAKYCNDCEKDICMKCEKNHKNHKAVYYGDILPNEDNYLKELREYLNKFNNDIKEIIKKFEDVMENMEFYYDLSYRIINNNKNRNYKLLKNINEFINNNQKILNEIKEINDENIINKKIMNIMNIGNKMDYNFILGEIDIKDKDINKDIRIINSFEQVKREKMWENNENDYMNENEKDIKNCEISINNEIIPFSYFYKFNKKGKNIIKYTFRRNLDKMNYLFYECESLENLNLTYFNTKRVTNMKCMFYKCNSLTDLNLSNLKTQNVTNMRGMFYGCRSLSNLDLSNFDTKNVIDMGYMFDGCESLTNLNLSNFNTQNVTDMCNMLKGCESLSNLNVTNFTTDNVIDMNGIFEGCESLPNLNISGFNIENVSNITNIFEKNE